MKKDYTYEQFLNIMERLRAECPWDREQTHESLKKYLIEEAYEVVEALDTGNPETMADELGDLFLQVVFHAQIGKEENAFTMDDVINAVANKMVSRHPHIFQDVQADTSDQVLTNWEEIKKKEKGLQSNREVLENISRYLPALMRAYKIWDKLIKWNKITADKAQLCQKSIELTEKLQKNEENQENILGEILFTNAGISRLCGLSPEEALIKFSENYIKTLEI